MIPFTGSSRTHKTYGKTKQRHTKFTTAAASGTGGGMGMPGEVEKCCTLIPSVRMYRFDLI